MKADLKSGQGQDINIKKSYNIIFGEIFREPSHIGYFRGLNFTGIYGIAGELQKGLK
jgi:hypothetical protein